MTDYITRDQRIYTIRHWKAPACELSDKRLAFGGVVIMGFLLLLTFLN